MDPANISTEIDTLLRKMNIIKGSLQSMANMDSVIKEIADSAKLKPIHTKHIAACDKALYLHIQTLIQEQTELIKLLETQQAVLQDAITRARPSAS